MMGEGGLKSENLDFSLRNLMVVAGGMIYQWKDIPMELLLQIVSLVDDRTVIVASGVCRGWRDAICWELIGLPFLEAYLTIY